MWSSSPAIAEESAAMGKIASPNKQAGMAAGLLIAFLLSLLVTAGITGCGYRNPYMKNAAQGTVAKKLHTTTWENRTNELGLESKYLRILTSWFKKTGRINIVFDQENADLKLAGEISSINLPGIFYDSFDDALEIQIKLTVNFTLTETRSNAILWQEKNLTFTEQFLLDPRGGQTEYNKRRALLNIGDEIAEFIYLRTHEIVSDME